jgi:hypothetical protein
MIISCDLGGKSYACCGRNTSDTQSTLQEMKTLWNKLAKGKDCNMRMYSTTYAVLVYLLTLTPTPATWNLRIFLNVFLEVFM